MANNYAEALQEFWEGFGWDAYDENTVPSEEQHPPDKRITYECSMTEFDQGPITLTADLWDRSYSWEAVTKKAKEIYDYIGLGGRIIKYNGGAIWIKRGSPFSQRMPDEVAEIRRVYLILAAEFFITN